MPTTDTSEKGLEIIITDWLIEHNCYERGALYGVGEYNKDFAVDETRLFRFLANTQPTEWAKLHLDELPNGKKAFLTYLSEKLSKEGVIELLRKEFRYKQAKLYLFFGLPSKGNTTAEELWSRNIFSVTRQLQYSKGNPSRPFFN